VGAPGSARIAHHVPRPIWTTASGANSATAGSGIASMRWMPRGRVARDPTHRTRRAGSRTGDPAATRANSSDAAAPDAQERAEPMRAQTKNGSATCATTEPRCPVCSDENRGDETA